jgi:hypothetical protein
MQQGEITKYSYFLLLKKYTISGYYFPNSNKKNNGL